MGSFLSTERFFKKQHPEHFLQHGTGAEDASDPTQSWIKSLPDLFLSSNDGVVASLISFVSELFQQVQTELLKAGLPSCADDLDKYQQKFKLWKDGKDDIDLRLDQSHKMREAIVFHLSNIVLVLETGLNTPGSEIQLLLIKTIRQCLEQASKFISHDLGQVPYKSEKRLIESFKQSTSKIQGSIESLYILSPDIDRTATEIEETEQRGMAAGGQQSSDEVLSKQHPHASPKTGKLFEALSKQYPRASQETLSRAIEANQERLRDLCDSRPEVADGGSGLIPRAKGFEGSFQTRSDHKTVQSPSRPLSISDDSTTSGSVSTNEKLPSSSSATSPSVQTSNHSLPRKINSGQSLAHQALHRPCCRAKSRTRADLEDHILHHVEPFHCSFENCDFGLLLFDSPLKCMEHEMEHHRFQYRWTCEDCSTPFLRQKGLEDHFCQYHNIAPNTVVLTKLLDKSRKKLYRPIQDEICKFCGTKSFPTLYDYADHVGKHMKQISSLNIDLISPLKHETMTADFTMSVQVWNYRKPKFIHHSANLDTGADDNFISSSIVADCGIQTWKITSDIPLPETLNGVTIKVTGWAEPKWRTENRNYRDLPFFIVEEIPGPEEMILGRHFTKVEASARRKVLALHNDTKRLNPEEKRRLDIQLQHYRADEEKRQAAIRAERDRNRESAGPQSELTVKHPQARSTEGANRT